jgi:hypothetical protein
MTDSQALTKISQPVKKRRYFLLKNDPARPVNYTVNLDWFEVLLGGEMIEYDSPLDNYSYDLGNIVFNKKPMGTKFYKYSYDVMFRGKPFGSINIIPRMTTIQKNTIQFQAVNNVLYEIGFISDFKCFIDRMTWTIKNFSRLDIAIDGKGFINIFEQRRDGKIRKLGKAGVTQHETGVGQITGYDVGKRSSNKWITGYNKSAELEISNKQYIRDMWDRSGLDSKNVERLEIKLRNEAIKSIINFEWEKLDSFEYLASIFRTQILNYFEFTKTSKLKNITRHRRYELLDWESIGGQKLPRLSTKQSEEVWAMKQASKTMYGIFCNTKIKSYADISEEIARNINCLQWYIEHIDRWTDFFDKKAGKSKTGEILYPYLSSYSQSPERNNRDQFKPELIFVNK